MELCSYYRRQLELNGSFGAYYMIRILQAQGRKIKHLFSDSGIRFLYYIWVITVGYGLLPYFRNNTSFSTSARMINIYIHPSSTLHHSVLISSINWISQTTLQHPHWRCSIPYYRDRLLAFLSGCTGAMDRPPPMPRRLWWPRRPQQSCRPQRRLGSTWSVPKP